MDTPVKKYLTRVSVDTSSVRAAIGGVILHWKIIAGWTIMLPILVLLVLTQIMPLYRSTAQVLIDPRKTQVTPGQSVVGSLPIDASSIESEVSILRSEALMLRVVEKLKLDQDPEFSAKHRRGLMAILTSFAGIASSDEPDDALPDALKGDSIAAKAARHISTIRALRDATTVSRQGLAFVITVSVQANNPAKAATIANAVVEAYLTEQLEARFDATKRASDWLQKRLTGLREQVEGTERIVENFRNQNNLAQARGVSMSEQQISDLNAQLVLARAQTAERLAKLQQAEKLKLSRGDLGGIGDVLVSPVITNLRTQAAEVARKEADLLSRYGDQHPLVINIRAERRDIQTGISTEVQRVVTNLRNEFEVARSREQSLADSLSSLQKVSGGNSEAVVRLKQLQRESESSRAVYESFLQRFKETGEQQTLPVADSRVISAAVPDQKPSFPRRGPVLGLSMFVGLLAGLGMAVFLDRMNVGFRTSSEVEQLLGLPTLSMVPLPDDLDQQDKATSDSRANVLNYLLKRPLSGFAESIRRVGVGVDLSQNAAKPPKIVLVSSAVPGEGKTTIASSMAQLAAQSGRQVLLIDCDLRRATATQVFNAQNRAGLSELLAGTASPETVFARDRASGLTFVPTGAQTQDPTSLLGSKRFGELLEGIRDTYDLIVLDASPIALVVDAQVVARFADAIVIVVEWGKTPKPTVVRTLQSLDNVRDKVAGIVLNKVNLNQASYYAGEYGAYSKKDYSSYYTS